MLPLENITQASTNMAGLGNLNNCLERPFYDAVISSHGVQFKVHKFILCRCSTYFRDLFLQHSAPDMKVFEVPGLSAATMQLIIEFAYTGSISLTKVNVQELFKAADQFIITGIKQACCNFLLERLSSENCIDIWQLSNIFCPELKQKAYHYLLSHFEEFVSRKEFQQLSVQELSGILDSDELNVRREMTLCEAILKWVANKPAEREQYLTVLLSKVRLALTSGWFITAFMNTAGVRSDTECKAIVQQAQKLKTYMPMLRPSFSVCSNPTDRPRLPNTILFAIGGGSYYFATTITEVYDFKSDRWKTMSHRGKRPHTFHGTVYCKGSIYCVGGIYAKNETNRVYRFDLATHTWLEVAPMHHLRCFVSAAVLDGYIYALGGFDGRHHLRSAERYDPETNQWSFIASMHKRRSYSSCTALHNKIYICGDYHRNYSVNSCEFYCPETDQWTRFTSMRTSRKGLGIIAYKDLIFAVGGTDIHSRTLNSVETYNPQTNTWHVESSMLTSRCNFGIAVIDDKLFVVGGAGNSGETGTVEYYDMSTNLWSEACQIKTPRNGLSCCVVSGLPDVAEYVISRDNLYQPDE